MSELYSFKEMCAKFEITPRTLRYYEYIELIAPKKEGKTRFYGQREVARMTLILRGKRFGFSLEELRQWLLIYETEGTEEQNRVWQALAERQLQVLIDRRDALNDTIKDLQTLRDQTARPRDEDHNGS